MANREVRNVHINITSNEKGLKGANKQVGGLKGGLKAVASAASVATGGLRAMATALMSTGIGAIVVALGAFVGLVKSSINESREFSIAMSGLGAVLGKERDELEQFSKQAKMLGATTIFTAAQVGELQTEFAKLGFTQGEILNVTEATLMLAQASGTDLANAAMVAGSTLRGFGLAAHETQRVVDVMAKSFNSSALDITLFQEGMKLVAPIAKTVKVSLEESSAALSILADRGIKGSLAGTKLRKIMSELATKTGKDFNTSLEIAAEKLNNAGSTSEKLAIATDLVGDRMKDGLIILAENKDKLDELTASYENAEGSAERMAEIRFDNLEGDMIKLKSAWSGFLLSIEDGEGPLNGLARGAMQALTQSLNNLEMAISFAGHAYNYYFGDHTDGATGFNKRANAAVRFATMIMAKFAELKVAIGEIPIFGAGIDLGKAKAQLAKYNSMFKKASDDLKEYDEANEKARAEKGDFWTQWKNKRELVLENQKNREISSIQDEFVEGGNEESDNKAIEDRKRFLEKLKKAEQDQKAKDEEAKIELERERHLAELERIEANETEKLELRNRINAIYDDKLKDMREKARTEYEEKQAEEKFKEEEKYINDIEGEKFKFEERLNRLTTQEEMIRANKQLNEEQKTKLLAQNAKARTAIEKEEAENQRQIMSTVQNMMGAFADLAGKQTSEGKAISIAAALINTYAGMSEIWGKKSESPFVGASLAQKIAASATVLASGLKTVKSIKKVKVPKGSGGGGANASAPTIQAPNFNVIGQTSVGEGQIIDAIQQGNQQPVQAYVVESQMTNSQELNRNVSANASIG
jgi:TP901 family phage tail tape measure protein